MKCDFNRSLSEESPSGSVVGGVGELGICIPGREIPCDVAFCLKLNCFPQRIEILLRGNNNFFVSDRNYGEGGANLLYECGGNCSCLPSPLFRSDPAHPVAEPAAAALFSGPRSVGEF